MSDWSFYDRGLSLFPLTPRTKRPALDWEAFQHQRAAPELVAAWRQHHWNTGVATGAVSGVIVLDCDNAMARLAAEERGIPDTLTIATPRGTHFYFNHPGWDVRNRAGRGWTINANDPSDAGVDGWDLRGDGGYVVGPGSYYVPTPDEAAKGKVEGTYSVERDAPIADAPDWLLALTFPRVHKPNAPAKVADHTTDYGRAALNAEMAVLMSATAGGVNEQINLSAFAIGQLVAGGEITSEEGWGALQEALAVLGIQDEEKAQGTLERGWTAGMGLPRAVEHHDVRPAPDEALGTRAAAAPPPPGVPAAPPPPVDTPYVAPDGTLLVRGQTIWHENMDKLFRDCWFIQRQDAAYVKGHGVLSATSFDTVFGGFEFPTTIEGSKKTRSAWDAFRLSPSWSCPIAYDICFRPDKTPGAVIDIEGRAFINTYEPVTTKRIAGDPSRFLDLLHKLLPDQRDFEILTSYMCALVQNPGRKFQWWPVLQGVKGNGKTLVLTVLAYAVSQRYTHLVNPEAMGKTGNQFNSWVQGNLFVGVEEIFVSDQRHILETFKPLVTNSRIALEAKGKDQTTGDNFANGIMLTNHRDGVPISDDERRYAIFWTAQQTIADLSRDRMNSPYFPDLWDWLYGRNEYEALGENYGFAVVNHWLATTPPVEAYNPAGLCQRAPETSSTKAAIKESLGTLEQEVLEAIGEHRVGFRGGWISSHAMRGLFQSLRVTIGPKRYRSIVTALGFVPHPALADGRVSAPLKDGTRPRIYVDATSPAVALGPEEAIAAFEHAQAIDDADARASNVVRLVPR